MRSLAVQLPPSGGAYTVRVGKGLESALFELIRGRPGWRRIAVVADDRVAALHGGDLLGRLRAAGMRADLFSFPAGEANKNRATKARLEDALLAAGLGRDSLVLALGGGVTIDLAGFLAATYMRGVPFIALPTTVLAMLDSSIGGKTGVDVPAGKNLIGAFHRPSAVFCDVAYLDTLPDVEFRTGLAEAVKHALIASPAHLADLDTNAESVLTRRDQELERVIVDSIQIKIGFVERDEKESGARKALNFGHTFGHALERLSGWTLSHGEAVARGLIFETRLSQREGQLLDDVQPVVLRVLRRLGLPEDPFAGLAGDLVPPPHGSLRAEDFIAATRLDKKARDGRVEYVMLRRIGEVIPGWTRPVAEETVRGLIEATTAPR